MAKRNTFFQDEVVEKKIDMKQMAKILRYILPYKMIVVFVLVLMVISSGVALISPLLLKQIIDNVVVTENYTTLTWIIFAMAGLAAIEITVTLIHQRLMGSMGHKIIATIRKDIFYKLQELKFSDSQNDEHRLAGYASNLILF